MRSTARRRPTTPTRSSREIAISCRSPLQPGLEHLRCRRGAADLRAPADLRRLLLVRRRGLDQSPPSSTGSTASRAPSTRERALPGATDVSQQITIDRRRAQASTASRSPSAGNRRPQRPSRSRRAPVRAGHLHQLRPPWPPRTRRFPLAQRGMTLVEVLVGLAIGLIGMLVIFQAVSVWDARTRATSAGSDAQVAGSLAMFSIERDLKPGRPGLRQRRLGGHGLPRVRLRPERQRPGSASRCAPVDHRRSRRAPTSPTRSRPCTAPRRYYASEDHLHRRAPPRRCPSATARRLQVAATSRSSPMPAAAAGTPTASWSRSPDDSTPADPKTMAFVQGSYAHFYTQRLQPAVALQHGRRPRRQLSRRNGLQPRPAAAAQRLEHRLGAFSAPSTIGIHGTVFVPIAEGVVDMKAEYGYDTDPDGRSDRRLDEALPRRSTGPRCARSASPCWCAAATSSGRRPMPASRLLRAQSGVARVTAAPTQVNFVMTQRRRHDRLVHSAAIPARTTGATTATRVYEKVFPLRNVIWGQ